MPEINYVTAQLSPDQVCEGFYTVEDGVLRMVRPDGAPVERSSDVFFEHRLKDTDNEIAIAKMLTKKVREHLRDASFPGPKVEGFDRDMTYQQGGVA